MNYYEIKQAAKKERYEAMAIKTAREASQLYEKATAELSMIPFGQPILVGHHSERVHRNLLERNHNRLGKSFEMQHKAEYYENKAENMGKSGISSDDPEAVTKLKEKLLGLQTAHQVMNNENKLVKGAHESWELSNSSANIRSTQKRIEQLMRHNEMEAKPDVVGNGWTLSEDKEENRVMFTFKTIPIEETRTLLKSHGFKWSPTRSAWVRQLNNRARYYAELIASKI